MNAVNYISSALLLLQVALDAAKQNKLADEVIADIQASIAKLEGVIGSDVTWSQLDGLRVQKTW